MAKNKQPSPPDTLHVENLTEAHPQGAATGATAPSTREAQAAYESRKPIWKTLGGVELGPPRVNLAFVTARVIQIGDLLTQPETFASFLALAKVPLPGGVAYDAERVRAVPVIARALWYARTQYLTAQAQSSKVALPPALVSEANDLRTCMLKVIDYNCVDMKDPNDLVRADLTSIEAVEGPIYLDTATDLSRLAAYYHSPIWLPILQRDLRYYDPSHAAAADRLAAAILSQLHNRADDAATWLLEIYRGWADLNLNYDVARRGATFVYWSDPDEKVPPLGALRAAPSRKAAPVATPPAVAPPAPPAH